ncbi:receptor-type tyrosine-protein phosphatase H-like [Littorina saxatilis]|uniref:receptor-type tyrosine-protein phosphatase H-like n=1 Tax=Littorina saxatilis TaxID=31220 RepID=UPI0038B5A661
MAVRWRPLLFVMDLTGLITVTTVMWSFSLYVCDAAAFNPASEQTDAADSGSEQATSGSGGIITFLRTHESVDLSDVTSGYLSVSSGDNLPLINVPRNQQPVGSPGKSGQFTRKQDFQSGNTLATTALAAQTTLTDTASKPGESTDTFPKDLGEMLKEEDLTVDKTRTVSPVKKTPSDGHSTAKETTTSTFSTTNTFTFPEVSETAALAPGIIRTVDALPSENDVLDFTQIKKTTSRRRESQSSSSTSWETPEATSAKTTSAGFSLSLTKAQDINVSRLPSRVQSELDTLTGTSQQSLTQWEAFTSAVLMQSTTIDQDGSFTNSDLNDYTEIPQDVTQEEEEKITQEETQRETHTLTQNGDHSMSSVFQDVPDTAGYSTVSLYDSQNSTIHIRLTKSARETHLINDAWSDQPLFTTTPRDDTTFSEEEERPTNVSASGKETANQTTHHKDTSATAKSQAPHFTTADGSFTTQIGTTGPTNDAKGSEVTGDEFHLSAISRTSRQTWFTHGQTFRIPTADVSFTTSYSPGGSTVIPTTTSSVSTTPRRTIFTATTAPSTIETSTTDEGLNTHSGTLGRTTAVTTPRDTTSASSVASITVATIAIKPSGLPCSSGAKCTYPRVCVRSVCTCAAGYFGMDSLCLEEPYAVNATRFNSTCLRLRWSGADIFYNVTIQSLHDNVTQQNTVPGQSYTACGFTPGSSLKASVSLKEGGISANFMCTLNPSTPISVEVTEVNTTCVKVTWRPGVGHTDSYHALMTQATSGAVLANVSTSETQWTKCGLQPGTEFNIVVTALSASRHSMTPATVGPDSTTPSAPTEADWDVCLYGRQRCISLHWTPGEGDANSYRVVILEGRRDSEVTGISTRLEGLSAATRYTVEITAVTITRQSTPLQVDVCTAPEPVYLAQGDHVDSTSAELHWKPPSTVEGFMLQWNNSQGSTKTMSVLKSLTHLRVDGLRPGTTYEFRIFTVFCGLNTSCTPLLITTKLSDLTAVDVKPVGTRLNISWATEEDTSSLSGFYIQLKVKDERGETATETITTSPYIFDTHKSGMCFTVTLTANQNSRMGRPYSVKAYTEEAAPGKVKILDARRMDVNRTVIDVTWSRPEVRNGVIVHYVVLMRGQRGLRQENRTLSCEIQCVATCQSMVDVIVQATFASNETDIAFRGGEQNLLVSVADLSEYENYQVEVVAATNAGQGPPSLFVVLGQLLDVVTDLNITAYNSSCVNLTWRPPANAVNNSLTNFFIEYQQSDDRDDGTVDGMRIVNTTDTIVLVCQLEFWTEYQFNVTAANRQGMGRTDTGSARTAEYVPEEVVNLTVSAETDIFKPRTLTVRWYEPVNKNGHILTYYVIVHRNDTKDRITEIYIHPRTKQNASSCEYYTVEITLNGGSDYDMQVFGATSAGNGTAVWISATMPAGAIPRPKERVSVLYPPKGSAVRTDTAHVKLPASLLCNVSYGGPVTAGYIVYRDGWTEREGGIRNGVSMGQRPVVTKSWSEVNLGSSNVAYLVHLSTTALQSQCADQSRAFSIEVGQRNGSWLCTNRPVGQCGGPLRPDTVYGVMAVFCTSAACTYSPPSFKFRTLKQPVTEDDNSTVLAAGLSVVFLLLTFGSGAAYYMYKKQQKPRAPVQPESPTEPTQVMEEVCRSRPVPVDDFFDHVEQLHKDSNLGFSNEYRLIKDISRVFPATAADLQVNRPKNRYKNILPYDWSRVELQPTDDEEGSDYINASYLPGENSQREFIAAQGPLPGTIDDFWRMVWENRVSVMVMLTQCVEKGRTKCEKYWPDEGVQEIYGDLVVHLRSQSVLPDYIIRVIDITHGSQSRMIKHFHFMRWPDHGCPEKTSMLLSFVSSVRAHMPHSDTGPMLVHCSAGVGRTGTFIALDQLLRQIHRQTTEVDMFGLVLTMRDHRTQMVQTENQYIYIHDCLADALAKDQESDDDQSYAEDDEHIYGNC